MSGCGTWSESRRSDGGYCLIQLLVFMVSDVSFVNVQSHNNIGILRKGLQTENGKAPKIKLMTTNDCFS